MQMDLKVWGKTRKNRALNKFTLLEKPIKLFKRIRYRISLNFWSLGSMLTENQRTFHSGAQPERVKFSIETHTLNVVSTSINSSYIFSARFENLSRKNTLPLPAACWPWWWKWVRGGRGFEASEPEMWPPMTSVRQLFVELFLK